MKAPAQELLTDPQFWKNCICENVDCIAVETTKEGRFVRFHYITKYGKNFVLGGFDHKIEIFDRPDQSTSEEYQIMSDDCLSAKIGEIGNQIHNLGCEHQNDEDLSDRLSTLSIALWDLAKHAPTVPAEPDWNGEGLPPADIECEVFDHEEKQYSRCKTLSAATMSGERACATIEPKGHFGRLIWGVNFRPIRTKEQQERESAITKARNACPYPGSESTKIDVEALYDAGMLRKEAE
jgi:hypothetical protein